MNHQISINICQELLLHVMEQVVHLILIQKDIKFQINVNFHLPFHTLNVN